MTNTRITLRLPEKLKEQLDKLAKEMGVSINALIVQILWQHFEKRE